MPGRFCAFLDGHPLDRHCSLLRPHLHVRRPYEHLDGP